MTEIIVSRLKSKSLVKTTEVYDTYWYFAAERQKLFFRRLENIPCEEWTEDPILLKYKFTNAYRASDRVSQYLIKNIIYSGSQSTEEVFFRSILFKLFNRIETWQLLEKELGQIRYSEYEFVDYDRVLTDAIEGGKRIYSAAYIMPSGGSSFGHKLKHRNNLRLLEKMMNDKLPHRLTEVKSMKQAFDILISYPTIGNFLGYQYVIDLNYSEILNFSENDFVIPGPGALSGIQKCFSAIGDFKEPDIIKMMVDRQEEEFIKRNIDFKSLWGRPLQLIDCQNLFCEVDKYARVKHPNAVGTSNRTRIKQIYKSNFEQISYWYPPKWKINKNIIDDNFAQH